MEWDNARRCKQNTLSYHAFEDLSNVPPLVFLFLLKECYGYGTCKAIIKFRALQQQVYLALLHNPQAGPTTLIAHCLFVMHILELYYDGFSHLLLSALCRLPKAMLHDEDKSNAKVCAAKLFLDIIDGSVAHNDTIATKVAQVFDVQLCDIDNVMQVSFRKSSLEVETSKEVVEGYVSKLIELQSYMKAVDLLIHFSMHQSAMPLLQKMMEERQYKAAEKWATYLGKPTLCSLVQEYVDKKLPDLAYDVIKRNNLHQEFPELCYQHKESSLKKLAEKGVWEIAEARAKGNKQLLGYLVYLAMEAGYFEKVEELSDRYSLEGFLNFKEAETIPLNRHYLNLNELLVEDVVWVDEVNILRDAICYLKDCKVTGVDCEWKPIYEKGSPPSKVSIMQIASEKVVYIFDLITLYEVAPTVLDECLSLVLQSPRILKLGYNFQCDVKMLASSYKGMNCFKYFEMLLDIQNLFKEHTGGLSGLALKFLGSGLNKTRRNSNWEQRPLSQHQLEYAALDAAVLLHIFRHAGSQSPHGAPSDVHSKAEWKSHILAHVDSATPAKQGRLLTQ